MGRGRGAAALPVAEHSPVTTYVLCGHFKHPAGVATVPAGRTIATCLTAPTSQHCSRCCFDALTGHTLTCSRPLGVCWPCPHARTWEQTPLFA